MRFLDWLVVAISLILVLSSAAALLHGGPAYQEDDGTITYTSTLQSSGSNDALTLLGPVALFGAFLALVSWWPAPLRVAKVGAFFLLWLIQLPNWYMEAGTYSATIFAAGNWWVAVLILTYVAAPPIIIVASIWHALIRSKSSAT